MTLEEQEEFPENTSWGQLWSLSPGCVYLNHGSFGPSPLSVRQRRQQLLEELEAGQNGAVIKPRPTRAMQLSFLSESDPALQELKALDISTMTPLEAINKLYELQRRVGKE